MNHKNGKNGARVLAAAADKHVLYEAAVQCVEADVDFFERIFRKIRKRPLRRLKEDFCGTAALAADFVKRHPRNLAWGVDLHQPTLDWGIAHHVSRLGPARKRITLLCDNVLRVTDPKVDLVCALNFSYSVFKARKEMVDYFRTAHASLARDGVFVVDAFGGTEAMDVLEERRRIPATLRGDGFKTPSFTYVWDQHRFNAVDHHILCYIHFEFRDGSRLERAFTYDWRLWTLPELQEMLLEAGFSRTEVYLEGWDDDADEADGIFRRRKTFENMAGWVGYVVGIR